MTDRRFFPVALAAAAGLLVAVLGVSTSEADCLGYAVIGAAYLLLFAGIGLIFGARAATFVLALTLAAAVFSFLR